MTEFNRNLARNCFACEFLYAGQYGKDSPTDSASALEKYRESLSPEELRRLQNGESRDSILKQSEFLACRQGVWREEDLPRHTDQGLREFLAKPRGESCFFYARTAGMSAKAATELERRQANRREAGKDRQLTRRAFWVAFAALLVSILAFIANLLWNIWAHFHASTP